MDAGASCGNIGSQNCLGQPGVERTRASAIVDAASSFIGGESRRFNAVVVLIAYLSYKERGAMLPSPPHPETHDAENRLLALLLSVLSPVAGATTTTYSGGRRSHLAPTRVAVFRDRTAIT